MEQTNYNPSNLQEDVQATGTSSAVVSNQIIIDGKISTDILLSHNTHGENIYSFTVSSPRLNNEVTDDIPVEVSERVVDINSFHKGDFVRVVGQFRSYNQYDESLDRVRLKLFIFARDIEHSDNYDSRKNSIRLIGFICKNPVFRTTPQGREISDAILAVNRMYKKTDYIPCIAWSRNARFLSRLEVGTKIELEGRVQSRSYRKKISEEEFESRTVYEVSISSLQVLEVPREREESNDNQEDIENS